MRILHTLNKINLIPVVPKIAKLVKAFLAAVKDNNLTITEATDLVVNYILPILSKAGVKLPAYVSDILPELVVKVQKASVLMIKEASEQEGVV
jgi:hypothetical protein